MKNLLMMRTISCALLITDNERLLLVNPTNHSFWEPPKGMYDFNEDVDFAAGAIRECKEETGLDFDNPFWTTEFVGVFNYNKKKDLAVTILYVDKFFFTNLDSSTLKCESKFLLNGIPTPEIQDYAIVTWEEAYNKVLPHMEDILRNIKEFYFPYCGESLVPF